MFCLLSFLKRYFIENCLSLSCLILKTTTPSYMVITRVYTNWSILIQLEKGWNVIKLGWGVSTQKSSAPHFTSNEIFTLMWRPSEAWVIYTCFLGIWVSRQFRETWKVMRGLHFHISHQLRTYSHVKFIWGLSYSSFMNIKAILGNWAQNYE